MNNLFFLRLLTVTFLSTVGDNLVGAQNSFTIDPSDHLNKAQCPGVEFVYKISPRNDCYSVDFSNTEGTPVVESTTMPGPGNTTIPIWKITLKWKDIIANGSITLNRNTSQSCANQTPEKKEFLIPIVSVSGKKPTLFGQFQVVAGKKVQVQYEADLNYEVFGLLDPIPFEADYFEWKKPASWNFIGTNQNAKNITFLTDLCGEGLIEVRGRSKCGRWSEWEKLTVTRYAHPPCLLSSTSTFVVCEDKAAISFTANPDNTLTGYTYEWEKPAGWTWEVTPGSGSIAVSVKPDGFSGGTVRVRSVACGKTSEWCALTLPLVPINPFTTILGTATLCREGYQTLSIPPPPSSTINWSITPAEPFAPYAQGAGEYADLKLNSQTFGGPVTITFEITTLCGMTTLTRTFFAGLPKIFNQRIDGVLATSAEVCPGTHYVSAQVLGATPPCPTCTPCFTWEVTGNNPYFASCNTVDIFMDGYHGTTAINANVFNICGTNDSWFFLTPKRWGCEKKEFYLQIYPNPAVDEVFIETKIAENSLLTESPLMNGIRLMSNTGKLVYQSTQVSDRFTISLAGVPPGTYTLTSIVDGIEVSEIIQVKLN